MGLLKSALSLPIEIELDFFSALASISIQFIEEEKKSIKKENTNNGFRNIHIRMGQFKSGERNELYE